MLTVIFCGASAASVLSGKKASRPPTSSDAPMNLETRLCMLRYLWIRGRASVSGALVDRTEGHGPVVSDDSQFNACSHGLQVTHRLPLFVVRRDGPVERSTARAVAHAADIEDWKRHPGFAQLQCR